MARIRDRLLIGTFFNLVATIFNQGSTFLVNLIVARLLSKSIFGEYAMVQNTLVTAATFSQVATGYASAKYIAEFRAKDPEKAGRILGLCAILVIVLAGLACVLVALGSGWLAESMLKAPQLASALAIGTGFLFFSALNGLQTGALSGFEAYPSLAKAGVISGFCALGAITFGAWASGLNGAVAGLSVSAFLRCVIHNHFLRAQWRANGIKPRYFESFRAEKEFLYQFIFPSTVAQCYYPGMIWIANSILVRQTNGYLEMGLYSVASSFRMFVLFLPSVINNVGFSVLNNESAKGDVLRHQKVFRWNVTCISVVCLAGAIILGLLGPQALRMFGKGYREAYPILLVLLASSVFEAVTVALYQYILMKAKMWRHFFSIMLPRELILVALAYVLAPRYGALGLAGAYCFSVALGMVLHFLLVRNLYRREKTEVAIHTGSARVPVLA